MRRIIGLALAMIGLLCFSVGSEAAQTIGTTAAVNPQASGTPPGSPTRTLVLGNDVVFKERIDTSGEGLVQVLFVDGTTLTVGPGSRLMIDQFVYDPNAGTGKLVVTFAKGAMRLIGGKLSKKEPAVINTPFSTLGIRGGIANFVLEGSDGCWKVVWKDKSCRALFSLLFGKELTFIGHDGARQTLYKQGYTLEISGETGGRPLIRRTRTSDIQMIQKKLAGKPGQSGGAKERPTNKTVSESILPESNSETAPEQYAQANTASQSTPSAGNPEQIDPNEASMDSGVSNSFESRSYNIRMLTTSQVPSNDPVFDVSFLPPEEDPTNPGSHGLVGGTNDPNADINVVAQRTSPTTLQLGNGQILPFTDEPGTHPINFPGGSGTLFVGPNADFLFYATFANGDLDKPTYAFAGVATPASALLGQDRLRIYDLQADPRQGISMPFVLADLVPNAQSASVSQLYVMEPNGVPLGDDTNHQATGASTVLLGGLVISGQGVDQNSAVSVLVGRFVDDAFGPTFFTSRRGSARVSSDLGSLSFGGGLTSLATPEGAHVLGPNGENFVLSSNFQSGDVFGTSPARNADFDTFGDDLYFSTIHVADLVNTQDQSILTRSNKLYSGYAAGMLESRQLNDIGVAAIPYRSLSDSGVILRFDADRDTIGGAIRVRDVNDLDPDFAAFRVEFGRSLGDGLGGAGRGAYVDDDRYAARQSNDPEGTFIVTDSNETIFEYDPANDPSNTYFLGSELAPQTGFFPSGKQPCVCKFLEWGYWGTRINWKEAPESTDVFSEIFHLGTWVAGDVTNEVDLPESGSASFNGHAVGNVARVVDDVTHQYIAGGGFDMTWNFAARAGTATISDFDGFTVSGSVASTSLAGSSEPNQFDGALSGDGLSGGLDGSFVAGPLSPAQGVIGSFDLSGAGYSATGIIAGEQ